MVTPWKRRLETMLAGMGESLTPKVEAENVLTDAARASIFRRRLLERIEGIVREVRKERDRPMKVIATGGLASLFAQDTALFDSVEDDLTMHGLVLIHRYNKELENA